MRVLEFLNECLSNSVMERPYSLSQTALPFCAFVWLCAERCFALCETHMCGWVAVSEIWGLAVGSVQMSSRHCYVLVVT